MIKRKMTRQISIGDVKIGGGAPISVQSMTNTKTTDTNATVAQIKALVDAGCDIVRVAVPDMSAAENIYNIKSQVDVPLVADIHFDYRLALKAIEQGIDALRINPGNIGDEERVKAVVEAAKTRNIPIRIGVNAGSLDKKLLAKYGKVTAEALVESALEHIRILEKLNFYDIKISLKAHDVPLTLDAYRLMSETVDYPLHLGITEAGTVNTGIIKSWGESVSNGVNAYFSYANDNNLIKNKIIEFLVYDDKYEPELTYENTQKLVYENKVFALFGFVGTPTIKRVLPILYDENIPFFSAFSGASFLRNNKNQNFINFRSSYDQEIDNLINYLNDEKKLNKIAVFYQNDDYGEEGYISLLNLLKNKNLKLNDSKSLKKNKNLEVSCKKTRILLK